REDDGSAVTPVFVEESGAVPGLDRLHYRISFRRWAVIGKCGVRGKGRPERRGGRKTGAAGDKLSSVEARSFVVRHVVQSHVGDGVPHAQARTLPLHHRAWIEAAGNWAKLGAATVRAASERNALHWSTTFESASQGAELLTRPNFACVIS